MSVRNDYQDIVRLLRVTRFYGDSRETAFARACPAALVAAEILVEWYARRLVCRVRGHRLRDDSTAGPDSGTVSLRCTRCGWSHFSNLY